MSRRPQYYSDDSEDELQLDGVIESQGLKRARDETTQSEYQVSQVVKKTKQTRGKNWDERDSLFLIEAVEYADGSKKRILTHIRIILK